MSTQYKLGNIKEAYIGLGGPANALLGLHVLIGNSSWEERSLQHTFFRADIPASRNGTWNDDYRTRCYATMMYRVSSLLTAAEVTNVTGLVGKPIRATFKDDKFKAWELITI